MLLKDCQNIKDVYAYFMRDEKEVIDSLIDERFLSKPGRCKEKGCRRNLVLYQNQHYKGHYAAYCKKCKKYSPLTKDTFFAGTHLSFEDTFVALWYWTCHISPKDASKLTSITRESIIQYYRYFRDIASWKILSMPPKQIGGAGSIVQIDESVVAKRKYNRGRVLKEKWVLGMYDHETKEGVILYVQKRDKQTLVPLIQTHVKELSIVWTDEWAAYKGLDNVGYVHETVNHSKEFVSPTGVCTNGVEGYWAKLKKYCRHVNVLWSALLPEHIDEFMWRDMFRGDVQSQYCSILDHIRERYPV